MLRRFRHDRRASVALLTALAAPVALGVMAMGIDASDWELTRIQLQRMADIAAMAGASQYAETFNAAGAASTAATSAELNGLPAGTRSGSNTVTDDHGNWSASFAVNTTANGSTVATVSATVQTSAPVWFAATVSPGLTQTISATAVAAVAQAGGGGQACLLALKGDAQAITTDDDISLSGNTTISSSTCDIRSDGSLTLSGNASTAVPSVIASGTITTSGNAKISCANAPCSQARVAQIPDPFYSTYHNDLSIPAGVANGTVSGSTYSPGLYSNLSLSGNSSSTLNPGVYYVTGSISVSGNASLTGNGVTLISNGGIAISGNGSVSLTAPSSGATAGLLYGTSSSSSVALSGNSNVVLNGAIYVPNAPVTLSGNASSFTTKSTCLDVVASTATFSGNSDFSNTGCAGLGVPAIFDSPATAKLVQ